MRARVTHALRPLDAIAVENAVLPGTPDVEFIGGWVELKSADRWPARAETPLRLEHFSPEQRAWLRRRCRRGGNAWLLLRVGTEWLLFPGETAAAILGTATKAELLAAARRFWPCTPSDEELLMVFREERS
jgi:hypothetical protein